MAKVFLTPIDLGKNELRNARIQNLSSAPGSPVAGQVYWDTTLHQLGTYNDNSSSWVYFSSGTGDFSSNTSSSVDGEVVLFSGTGGKTGKRATGSGIAKLTSGVLSTATSGTDYAPATSGTSILKGNGSGGFSNAASGTDYAPATSGTSALKGNGSGGFSNAVLNDVGAATGDYSINSHKLTNVADPTSAQDAATKNYVDTSIQGLQPKPTARAATTAALATNTYSNGTSGVGATLTATGNGQLATVDGVSLGIAVNFNFTNVTNSGTTVTATVASTVGLAVGQNIVVTGVTGFTTNNPNGDYVVNTIPGSTTFTYVVGSAPTGSYSSGGNVVSQADIVLVKNEATAANNGLYTLTQQGDASHPYILTRHVDMDQTGEFLGAFLAVGSAGTTNANSLWLCNPSEGSVVVGTTSISFTQLNGATDLIAGNGIAISGNTVSIENSGVLTVAHGGTGVATLTGIVKASGTSAFTAAVSGTDYAPATATTSILKGNGSGGFSAAKYTTAVGDNSSTSITVTHNLGTRDVVTQVYQNSSTWDVVECDVQNATTNTVTLGFATAPTTNQYAVVVIG